MKPKNRQKIEARVAQAAYAALTQKGWVSAVDVLVGMSWLEPEHLARWRKGQIPYLEKVVHTNLSKISLAMKAFRKWAERMGLNASSTAYRGAGTRCVSARAATRGSRTTTASTMYRPKLSKAKLNTNQRSRGRESDKPREIVVFSIVRGTKCSACGTDLGKGRFLFKENDKVWCMGCSDLDHLDFLAAGSSKLTRRAKKYSVLSARSSCGSAAPESAMNGKDFSSEARL